MKYLLLTFVLTKSLLSLQATVEENQNILGVMKLFCEDGGSKLFYTLICNYSIGLHEVDI